MLKRFIAAIALCCAFSAHAQTATQITQPHMTFVDGAGSPCAGCSLYSYNAGTTTPLATYTDSSEGTSNTNPIILGTDGGANIWVGASSYKFVLKDVAGNTIWTVDNVSSFLPLSGGLLTGSISVNGSIYYEGQASPPGNPTSPYVLTYADTSGNWFCRLNTGSPCGSAFGSLSAVTLTASTINGVEYPAPGTTLKAAVDALPSTGGTINLAVGTYQSGYDTGSILQKQNVKIYGAGMPALNNTTNPTALTGGTIIQGEVDVAGYDPSGSANGFEMHNLGIDVGATVVAALYSGTAKNGLAMTNVGQVPGAPPTVGVSVSNVIVLGDGNGTPVHAMLFENLDQAHFAHLYSYFDGIGQVFKTTKSTIEDIHCSGHGTACAYLKSDTYAPNSGNTVDGFYADSLTTPGDTAGLKIDAGSASVDTENISNLWFKDTSEGVSFLMDLATGLTVTNVNITNFKMDDADIASGSRTAPCFFFFTTGTSTAKWVNVTNAICNNVQWGVWMTTNDTWTTVNFHNFTGTNFTSHSMILSGTVTISNASIAGLTSGFYGYLAEGTSATVVNLLNDSAVGGTGIFSTLGSPVINFLVPNGTAAYATLGANAFLGGQSITTPSGSSMDVMPPDDSGATKEVYGTNHAVSQIVWEINDDGTAAFHNIPNNPGTATPNQALCIKTAGPPLILGICSSVVSSGGACTCN